METTTTRRTIARLDWTRLAAGWQQATRDGLTFDVLLNELGDEWTLSTCRTPNSSARLSPKFPAWCAGFSTMRDAKWHAWAGVCERAGLDPSTAGA